MQFTSLTFAVFLALSLACYYLTPKGLRWIPLLAASWLFYAANDPVHLGVVILLTLTTYGAALGLARAGSRKRRLVLLWAGLAPVLIALAGFRLLASWHTGLAFWSIPLGMSFLALRLASYVIDVYRAKAAPERHVGRFSLFVSIFPELPAGPIDRAGALLPQLRSPPGLSYERVASGAKLFAWGLFKKIVIADRLRYFVDAVYDAPAAFDGVGYAVATVFFAFQIYCDFSGYSDMAIGLGEAFGLRFAKNFERPYHAKSIAEFWTRWHISFSSWLRDYIFLPVAYGTGRLLERRLPEAPFVDRAAYALAAATTMLLCGLWHGATWNYAAWGLIMAFYMIGSVMTRKVRAKVAAALYGRRRRWSHEAMKVATTFLLVNVSWVFFRANSLGDAVRMLLAIPTGTAAYVGRALAGAATGRIDGAALAMPLRLGQPASSLLFVVASLGVLLSVELVQRRRSVRGLVSAWPVWVRWPLYVTFVAALIILRAPGGATFIYAGF